MAQSGQKRSADEEYADQRAEKRPRTEESRTPSPRHVPVAGRYSPPRRTPHVTPESREPSTLTSAHSGQGADEEAHQTSHAPNSFRDPALQSTPGLQQPGTNGSVVPQPTDAQSQSPAAPWDGHPRGANGCKTSIEENTAYFNQEVDQARKSLPHTAMLLFAKAAVCYVWSKWLCLSCLSCLSFV